MDGWRIAIAIAAFWMADKFENCEEAVEEHPGPSMMTFLFVGCAGNIRSSILCGELQYSGTLWLS